VIVFIVFIVVLDRLILNRLQTRAFRWRDPNAADADQVKLEQVGG
jgi:hypothetical protein